MLVILGRIYISSEIQAKYNLPTNVIDVKHIFDLINYQKDFHFLLAPGLYEEDLLPDHLKKMKVKTTTNIVNHNVASGLKYMSEELNKPEYLTTAWFLELIWTQLQHGFITCLQTSKRCLK